jgi:N-acetylmuramic acid 6-phosphate etherase
VSEQERQPEKYLVIGINGGGTNTSVALLDLQGTPLATAVAGASNPNYVGWETALANLQEGIAGALGEYSIEQIAAIGACLAGIDRPSDSAKFRAAFDILYPGMPLVLENDAVGALVAGVGRRYGVVTISGTGMIAVGSDETRQTVRAGGWGHYIDQGSGYAIAREVLSAIARSYDGHGPQTALTASVQAALHLSTSADIIAWAYDPERKISQVASLASHAVHFAEAGDPVSVGIISRAAEALANTTNQVISRLNFNDEPIPLVMSGSIFKYSTLLRGLFTQWVQAVYPNVETFTTERDASIGAAFLALHYLGMGEFGQWQATASLPKRATERRNILTMESQGWATGDFLARMNIEDARVAGVIAGQLPKITALIDAAAERLAQGGRLIFLGAGTSGRLAVLDAAECRPTFSAGPESVVGILAGGPDAMLNAVEGAEDSADAGAVAMVTHEASALDVVIGVAASGNTPFVIGALQTANARGALTGCLVNVVGSHIAELVQHPIVLATGPEVLTGSTRLKAGTAQKLALNMISTATMRAIGRTYENLMTNMQASNIKLRKRAWEIVMEAASIGYEEAESLLELADGEMKTAIVMARFGVDAEMARARLEVMQGHLANALRPSE